MNEVQVFQGYTKEQVELMSDVERGKLAYAYHQQLVNQIIQIHKQFLIVGKTLYEIGYLELYKPTYESIDEYLTSPELDISRSWAYMLIGIHRCYVLKYHCNIRDLIEIGPKKLNYLRTVIDEQNIEEAFDRAKTLSYDDLRRSFNEKDINRGMPERAIEPGYYRFERAEPCQSGEMYLGTQTVKIVRGETGVLMKVE